MITNDREYLRAHVQLILMLHGLMRLVVLLESFIVALEQPSVSFTLRSAQVSLEHSVTSVHPINDFLTELPNVHKGRLESPDLPVHTLYARDFPSFLQIKAA